MGPEQVPAGAEQRLVGNSRSGKGRGLGGQQQANSGQQRPPGAEPPDGGFPVAVRAHGASRNHQTMAAMSRIPSRLIHNMIQAGLGR